MTLRAIRQFPRLDDPDWMSCFIAGLQREDLAAATVRGYRYDLRHFLAWHEAVEGAVVVVERLTEFDLIAYRQAMIAAWQPSDDGEPPPRCVAPFVPVGAADGGDVHRHRRQSSAHSLAAKSSAARPSGHGGSCDAAGCRRLDPRACPAQLGVIAE